MRVLMYGWEFPPHITGGLGTACHGLSTALSSLVRKITFVLPKIKGEPQPGPVELVSVRDLSAPAPSYANEGPKAMPSSGAESAPSQVGRSVEGASALAPSHEEGGGLAPSHQPEMEILTVPSSLRPYVTAGEYERQLQAMEERRAQRGQQWQPGEHGAEDRPSLIELSGDYGKNLFSEVARYASVASRIVLTQEFDVIHAHDWMTFSAGVQAKRMSGLPLVVHVHALEFDRSGENVDQRVYDIERYGMEQADRVIAVSQRTKDVIVARYGIPEDKVSVVYNGIIPAPEKRLPERRVAKRLGGKLVVFLGRITMQKGPEYFLEAAYLVSKKLPETRFVMAGSGDLLPRMIERMAELRLLDRFHFTGFVGERERDLLLAQADLLVMPSVSEPFGISPVEAVQYGVPVIITKQSGVSEILRHAVKVDFWDIHRTADAMIQILSTEGLSRQLIEGGREDLSNINWDRSAAQVKHIYEEIV